MIDLELFRIFKAVADEEKLTKASEVLNISQPAVTKHIRNLENELNVQLFTRSKYGMILNENGKKLYNEIKIPIEILLKCEDIFNINEDVNLGIHGNMPKKIYNHFITKYYDNNKNSVMNIHILEATDLFSRLANMKIDMVFSKRYSEELYNTQEIKFIKIGELHDVFIVNSDSKYLKKKITRKELKNTTIYTLKKFSSAYQNLVKALEYNDGEVKNIENVNFTAMIELLNVRDVITVMTQEYVEEKIAKNELSILDVGLSLPNAEYGIYYNVNNKSQKINNLIKLFTSGV